jgi:hypothetical protein
MNWTRERFLDRVESNFPHLVSDHKALLEALDANPVLEARFDGTGKKEATYKVFLRGAATQLMWVYDDGKLYVRWLRVKEHLGESAAKQYRDLWAGRVDRSNDDGANVVDGLGGNDVSRIVDKLTKFAMLVSGEQTANPA